MAPKRLRMDINNEDSEFPSDIQEPVKLSGVHNAFQTKQYIPQHLVGLMYQLDLSVLCSVRKLIYEHKYPSLSLAFGNSEIDKFNNIVLRYNTKSIYVRIEYVDKFYIDCGISYSKLFSREKRSSFFINDYFDSFTKYLMTNSDCLLNQIEFLVIYTNLGLDLTEDEELKSGRFKNFYPFKFISVNFEECEILKDLLFTNANTRGRSFYQLSQGTIREELLKRLEFPFALQQVIKERNLCSEEIKETFLAKLVFAVNQPNRDELNRIIKKEIETGSDIQNDYIELQEKILLHLSASDKYTKGKLVPDIMYEQNLFISFLYDMSLHKNIFSISSECYCDPSISITINYRNRATHLEAHVSNSNIDYSLLFPARQHEKKNIFSINNVFTRFLELKNDIRYFIIYTNGILDLTDERILKKGRSRSYYSLKFDSIDIRKRKYKILRNCSCINENCLYQFAKQETTREKCLSLLRIPLRLQKKKELRTLSEKSEKLIKEKFLDKLIFAVNQPHKESLNSAIRNEIDKSNVSYNYETLQEIALRWSESHEFGAITIGIMEKLLKNIKNNRCSYQKHEKKNVEEEIRFAKSVVGREGTSAFNQFLDFLTKGAGIRYFEVVKSNGLSRSNMSSILHGAGANATEAFKDLYDLWFEADGNKSQYLNHLEEQGISLTNLSSILHGARANSARAFKDLYDLWFDIQGNKTEYLKDIEKGGINLTNMSGMLSGAGSNAAKAFKSLYDMWFNMEGNKTEYLKTLEEEGVSLSNISSILGGVGSNAAKAFKDLYDLWFDADGNKTKYLKTLEKEGVNLVNMSSILHRARTNAVKAFKDLYDLWFDAEGNKTQYLKTLEKEEVNLVTMSSILSGAGGNAAKAFKNLYGLWFDLKGNKMQYLKTLEKGGVNLSSMSSILGGAGANAVKAFKDLYNLWFDSQGNKTQYLTILEKEGIGLANISSILGGVGTNAAKVFKDLYCLWFDAEGNKTHYLRNLEKEEIYLINMSNILHRARSNSAKAFRELYDIFLDNQGNKTPRLRHFTEDGDKSFKFYNLSSVLGTAGANGKTAFEKLHSVCFNDEGMRTQILEDFYSEGFVPSNLSCILCGAGARASNILIKLHSLCFDSEGRRSKLLDDFYRIGFRAYDLCNILSRAVENIEEFYEFCFVRETKQYLNHFLNQTKCFTITNLCNILHGTGANICSSLKDFHDICFDDAGKKMQPLDFFLEIGFTPNDLSDILSMAGNNAASILSNFHKFCIKKNYLNHFLDVKDVFTPKSLSKILYGVGTRICSTITKLHDLCFDMLGKKTKYLNRLIKNNPSYKIINILYEKVRKSCFLMNDTEL